MITNNTQSQILQRDLLGISKLTVFESELKEDLASHIKLNNELMESDIPCKQETAKFPPLPTFAGPFQAEIKTLSRLRIQPKLFKCYSDQKITSFFILDFKSVLA